MITTLAAIALAATTPTVDHWAIETSITCDEFTFSHAQFKQSHAPEFRVDVDGTVGDRIGYEWGQTITLDVAGLEPGTQYEVRIFAKNPDLNDFSQQLGAKKVWTLDCTPEVIEPEPSPEPPAPTEPTPTDEPTTPAPEVSEPVTEAADEPTATASEATGRILPATGVDVSTWIFLIGSAAIFGGVALLIRRNRS